MGISIVSVTQLNATVLTEALGELQVRLGPGQGGTYCDELEIPHVALRPDYAGEVAAIRALLDTGDHHATLTAARSLAADLPQYFEAVHGDDLSNRSDELRKRLLTPPVLIALRDHKKFFYWITLVSLFADERISEWYPQGSGLERIAGLINDIVPSFSTGVMADSPWPYWVVYALSLASIYPSMQLTERHKVGLNIGWYPGSVPDNPEAEAIALHGLSVWWERQRLPVDLSHYQGTIDDVAGNGNNVLAAMTLIPISDVDRQAHGIWVQTRVETQDGASDAIEIDLDDDWQLAIDLGVSAAFFMGRRVKSAIGGDMSLELRRVAEKPWISLGQPGLGASIRSFRFITRVEAGLDGGQAFDLTLRAQLDGVRIDLSAFSDDTFLEKLLPNGLATSFDFGVQWSLQRGFSLLGGVGTKSLRPAKSLSKSSTGFDLKVEELLVDVGSEKDDAGGYQLYLGLKPSVEVKFGDAVTIVLKGVGPQLVAGSALSTVGMLGPMDLDARVTKPTALGIMVDAGPVKGGGYLEKTDEGWAGALELDFKSWSLAGVGIVEGDSFLAVAWAQGLGGAPGWSLEGLGALVGIERRADRDALFAGVRTGSLEAILFPENPLEDAPKIIASLGQFFPKAAESFVFGAMARVVFGGAKARLVTADLGLVVSIVRSHLDSLYLLGRASVQVPAVSKDLFRINVEALGAVDFNTGAIELLLSLRDSRLGGGELTGDGYFRRAPGEGFVVALGGFHPRYRHPTAVPALRRLAVSLVDARNLKIGFQSYLALTSSSFQLGAKATLWASAGGFTLEGQLGFDLLVEFDLGFVLDLLAEVVLKRGARRLAAVRLEGTLSGCSPWRIQGRASLELLFFSVSVPVSYTIAGDTQGPGWAPPNLYEEVAAALGKPDNWSNGGRSEHGVRMRKRTREGVWMASQGALEVSQRVLPFHQRVERYGPTRVVPTELALNSVEIGTGEQPQNYAPVPITVVQEDFAPGLYFALTGDEAITAPAFEAMDAGFRVDLDDLALGEVVTAEADYEQLVIDRDCGEVVLRALKPGDLNMSQWTVIDEGNVAGPSDWRLIKGEMQQLSNIYSTPNNRENINKRATLAVTGDVNWGDVTLRATLESGDNDAMGLVFRYTDPTNYYRFSMDSQRAYRRLVKCVDGTFSLLWESDDGYTPGIAYQVRIEARGTHLAVFLDGQELVSLEDRSHGYGSIGLYSWGNAPTRFRDLELRIQGAPKVAAVGPPRETILRASAPLSPVGKKAFYRPNTAPIKVLNEKYTLLDVPQNTSQDTFDSFSAARTARRSARIATSAGTGHGAPPRLQVALLHEVNQS